MLLPILQSPVTLGNMLIYTLCFALDYIWLLQRFVSRLDSDDDDDAAAAAAAADADIDDRVFWCENGDYVL